MPRPFDPTQPRHPARSSPGAWRRLLRSAHPHRGNWTFIAALAAMAPSLAQPWPMKRVVDRALPPGSGAPAGSGGIFLACIAPAGLAIFTVNAGRQFAAAAAAAAAGGGD